VSLTDDNPIIARSELVVLWHSDSGIAVAKATVRSQRIVWKQ